MLAIGLALIRQCKAARGTGEETHPEAAFEFCEPARNDWQRHRQCTRRRRQAGRLGDLHEVTHRNQLIDDTFFLFSQ